MAATSEGWLNKKTPAEAGVLNECLSGESGSAILLAALAVTTLLAALARPVRRLILLVVALATTTVLTTLTGLIRRLILLVITLAAAALLTALLLILIAHERLLFCVLVITTTLGKACCSRKVRRLRIVSFDILKIQMLQLNTVQRPISDVQVDRFLGPLSASSSKARQYVFLSYRPLDRRKSSMRP
jgi:hypothetical protein